MNYAYVLCAFVVGILVGVGIGVSVWYAFNRLLFDYLKQCAVENEAAK